VDEAEKGFCILHSEVEKGIKEMRDKKAADDDDDDDTPGDGLRLLGEVDRKMTQMINSIYGTEYCQMI
jgi:hypothetical protein